MVHLPLNVDIQRISSLHKHTTWQRFVSGLCFFTAVTKIPYVTALVSGYGDPKLNHTEPLVIWNSWPETLARDNEAQGPFEVPANYDTTGH